MSHVQEEQPTWFCHLSSFQVDALARIRRALHYDIDEKDALHTFVCLQQIGLHPMVSKPELQKIIVLSLGDAFAFLYFLMEAYYKTPKPGYDWNEKLLMSSICYLDLGETIKALDRILPKQPQKKKVAAVAASATKFKSRRKPTARARTSQQLSPYFQKLIRPVPVKRKSSIIEPRYKVNCDRDVVESIQNFAEKNDNLYWFTKYEFNTEKRLVRSIINDEIGKLFDCIDAMAQLGEKQVLCAYHGSEKSAEKRSFVDYARQNCLHVINYREREKEAQRMRIKEQLECDVNTYLSNFGTNWCTDVTHKPKQCDSNCTICLLWKYESLMECKPKPSPTELPYGIRWFSPVKHCLHTKDSKISDNSMLDDGASQEQCHHDAEPMHYFNASIKNLPYQFDYYKIFKHKNKNSENLQSDYIQRIAVDALAEDTNSLNGRSHEIARDRYSLSNLSELEIDAVNAAIDKCVRNIWLKQSSATQVAEQQRREEQQDIEKSRMEILDYGLDYYNPSDTKLMNQMLSDAIDIMRKNPKYVLASLPDSHQLDMLHEWIRGRYGKVYKPDTDSTSREIADTIRMITSTMHRIPKVHPVMRDIITTISSTYDQHDQLRHLGKKLHFEYQDRICERLLETSRLVWCNLMSVKFTNKHLISMFDSYLPSSRRDIRPFYVGYPGRMGRIKNTRLL